MKVGLVANNSISNDWEESCKIANSEGIEAIEFAAGGFDTKRLFEKNVVCTAENLLKDKNILKRFLKIPERYNLEISALASKGNPLHPDKKQSEVFTNDILGTIELAKAIGVNTVIVFAGTPGAGEDAKYPNWIANTFPKELGRAAKWQWEKKIIPFWKKMVEKIKNTDINFAFELHKGDSVYNPELFLKLREAVDSEKITCNLDPSHLFPQGIDIETCIRRLGKSISYFHAKDCKIEKTISDFRGMLEWKAFGDVGNRAWNYRAMGYGHSESVWKGIISALRLTGYNGVLSIEHGDALMSKREGLRKSVKFLRDVMIQEDSEIKFG